MDIRVELITQEPIHYKKLIIQQPTFKKILKYGLKEYNDLLIPYTITNDFIKENADNPDINAFDLIMYDESLLKNFTKSMELFCNAKEITFLKDKFLINKQSIDSNDFDELGDIILKINSKVKPVIEKPPIFKSEKQKEIWEKLQKGRKRDAEKNQIPLCDILNICEFGGNYHIPIEEIKGWTLWRIMNCFQTIMGIKSYEDNFEVYLVSGEKKIIDGKHWTDLIKVTK